MQVWQLMVLLSEHKAGAEIYLVPPETVEPMEAYSVDSVAFDDNGDLEFWSGQPRGKSDDE